MVNPVSDLRVGLELDLYNRRLRWGGRDIALTPRAFALLAFLASRPHMLAPTEEILTAVWPNVVVEEGQVKQFVAELRRILHDDPKAPRLIETVRGRGYRFVGDLRIVGLPPAPNVKVIGRDTPGRGVGDTRRLTALIGRDGEHAAVQALVRESPHVTVTGGGGIGKTLLARHVVRQLADRFADGVVHVELAPLSDAELVVGAIAVAAGLPGRAGEPLEGLVASLAPLALLLVLDNAEHLVDEVARVVQALGDGAPRLHVLVTSQLPLRLPTERVFRLGPLQITAVGAPASEARACGAVALFLARARAVEPALSVSDGELTTVVDICSRLDGVPLAVELAAARLAALGLTPLAAAIGDGLQLLSAGNRGGPRRQRTLRSALEWTHGLLTLGQQAVFRRLGVFASSFDLATAQQVVCDTNKARPQPLDEALIADAVAALVDCSLLQREDADPPRWRMLESTRLFARECLGLGSEARAVRLRQLEHYTALCHAAFGGAGVRRARASAEPAGDDPRADAADRPPSERNESSGKAALPHERIAAEYSNIRGALEWAFGGEGDTTAGTALALALLPFWQFASEGEESAHWIELCQAHADDAPLPGQDAAAVESDTDRTVALLMSRLQAAGVIGTAEVAGIERAALLALARRLRPAELRDVDAAFKDLQHAVEIASGLIAPRRTALEPAAGGGESAAALVDTALARVAGHTRAGEFDHGVDAIDTALRGLADHRRRALAAIADAERSLLEAGVQQELLRRDAFAAARRVEAVAAIDIAGSDVRPAWTAAYRERERRFLDEGVRQAINLSLEVGIEMARRRLASAADGDERCDAERILAGALTELGDRQTGTEALQEAVAIYRAAIAHTLRERSPATWASLQNDLGAALWRLGSRTGDAAAWEAAALACREALHERRRGEAPLEWAETQHVLGMALRSLGAEAEGNGTLEAAVQALTEALKERTPARAPLGHVKTLTGLGVAYSLLGRRERGGARRRQAVQAYRAALAVARRDTAPLEWAALQHNLGIELSTIGEIERDVPLLREAVVAYRESLKEYTRERIPPRWASTQHNLGGALRVLGEREDSTALLHEAVAAFDAALQVHRRETSPHHWAATKNDLGLALLALGRRERDPPRAEEAVRVLRQALEERPRDRVPLDWSTTLSDLGYALFALGEVRESVPRVREALAAWHQARSVLSPDTLPKDDADVKPWIEDAHRWLRARGEPVE